MDPSEKIRNLIKLIHVGCFQLCKQAYGSYLPIAGNVAIFCQSDEEFSNLNQLKKLITIPSDNPNQKYFPLREPLVLPAIEDLPQATYSYLYIRKPASDSPELGDIDFVLNPNEYTRFKKLVLEGKVKGAEVYNKPGWDNIEVRDPTVNALTYIGTQAMAEKARIKF